MLDAAGFEATRIVASNDLDEGTIGSLKGQGARIDTWGVGTRLATCYDQPALGAVYKLTAIRDADGSWRYPVKASDQLEKVSIPGILGVRRYSGADGLFRADGIYDESMGLDAGDTIICPWNLLKRRQVDGGDTVEELLQPVLRNGDRVTPAPSLEDDPGAGAHAARTPCTRPSGGCSTRTSIRSGSRSGSTSGERTSRSRSRACRVRRPDRQPGAQARGIDARVSPKISTASLISAAVTSSGGIQRTTSCWRPQVSTSSPASAQAAESRSGSVAVRLAGRAVADELDADHQAGPTHVADAVVLGGDALAGRPAAPRRGRRRCRQDALVADRLEDRQAGRAGDRIAAVRRAVRAPAPALLERRATRRSPTAAGRWRSPWPRRRRRGRSRRARRPTSARSGRSRTGPRRR